MNSPKIILIALPTYNERENLPSLLSRIETQTHRIMQFYACRFDILVIDDDSPDGTGRWCEDHAGDFSNMKCLHRQGKEGLGSAILQAINYAVKHGYDRLISLDADLSHPPEVFPALLGISEDVFSSPPSPQRAPLPQTADVVIGSRYTHGGKISGWPWLRHAMSRAVNLLTRVLLRLSVRDTSGSFRNYSVEKLRKLEPEKIVSRGYSFFEEVLWRLKLTGASMHEVPIHFVNRRRGDSKLRWGECFRSLGILLRLGFRPPK